MPARHEREEDRRRARCCGGVTAQQLTSASARRGHPARELGERRLDLLVHRAPEDGEQRLARRAGATCSIDSASSSQRSSGMPASANGFETSSMNSLMNSLATTAREWRSTLSIMSSAWSRRDAARDDLLGGGEQRRARDLEVALAQRDAGCRAWSPWRAACAGRPPRSSRRRSPSSCAVTTSGVSGASRAARLSASSRSPESPSRRLMPLELQPLGLQLLDQPQPLDVLGARRSRCGRGPRAAGAARARGASARCGPSGRSRAPARRSSAPRVRGYRLWCYITQRDIKRRYIAPACSNCSPAKPAGGAALDQVAIATGAALFVTVVLLWLGLGPPQREGGAARAARPVQPSASPGCPRGPAIPAGIIVVSLITALFGMLWDISLHIAQGRDEGPLANAAHYFILAGLFGVFASGFLSMCLPLEKPRRVAVRITPRLVRAARRRADRGRAARSR